MFKRLGFTFLLVSLIWTLSSSAVFAKTEIDYWFSENNQYYWDLMKVIVDDFNASQNEVHVNLYTFIWKDMQNKLLTAIAGGAAPDVVALDGSIVAEWVATINPFISLDPYLQRYGITKDMYIPNEWQEGSLWGKQWALPWRTSSRGMYWNMDLFATAGLNPNQGPKTLEDIDQWTRKINRYTPQGKFEVLGFAPFFNNFNLQGWFWTFGGGLYDWQRNVYTLERPEHLEALKYVKSYVDTYGQAILDYRTGYSYNDRFANEQLGMLIQSTTYVSTLYDMNPNINYGVGVLPYPTNGANGNWGGGFSHAIPISAKNKDGAAFFLAYLAKPEVQLKYYEISGLLPTHFDAVRQLIRVTSDERVRIMIQGLPTANARTPYWLTVHNNLNKASNELITGVKPPEQILAEQQKLIEVMAEPLKQPRL
jgi:multiple sugar transport system substrate-binding protein